MGGVTNLGPTDARSAGRSMRTPGPEGTVARGVGTPFLPVRFPVGTVAVEVLSLRTMNCI
jgi:hypothetical protein